MVGDLSNQTFPRRDVRRSLKITERQLKSWERQELIPVLQTYCFADLVSIQTLIRLRQTGLSPVQIRRAVNALRHRLKDIENPLVELRLYREGNKVAVQVGTQKMEPVSGQFLLDFGEEELRKLLAFPDGKSGRNSEKKKYNDKIAADTLFQEALELEQRGATQEAVDAYKKVVELDPTFAGALVNLGTIYFTAKDLKAAEQYYLSAVEADPDYALARFNLGNLYDEIGKKPAALAQYSHALELNPTYADVHYNIALLYQASGQSLKAVHHWKTYLKLDPMSPWASIARRELDRVYRETVVEPNNQSS